MICDWYKWMEKKNLLKIKEWCLNWKTLLKMKEWYVNNTNKWIKTCLKWTNDMWIIQINEWGKNLLSLRA